MSGARATRVLVVDDHPAVRWGLVQLLEDQCDLEVAAVATTAEVAVGEAENEAIDVAVVDYQLGGRNGLWVTRKLRALPAPPRVVIFSAFANDHLAANCIVAGANALLSKSSLGEELCSTIRAVARGRVLLPRVPPPMVQLLRARLDGDEQIAFGMLLAGIPDAEVERALDLSAEELLRRRTRILGKLEALPGEAPGDERAARRERAVSSYLGVERC
ncbi:MAG TPA: response regulator transcription factor [Solirubrobacteraceae bacterium]|nr:response regulator transcription factor [Solirubrobacteraceae bacterium]